MYPMRFNMIPRANVVIYGLYDGIAGGRNTRGHKRTMGMMFNDLIKFIQDSDVASDVDIRFIDLIADNPGEGYFTVKGMLDEGYKLPFIMINDRIRAHGIIDSWNIYNDIKKYLEQGYI